MKLPLHALLMLAASCSAADYEVLTLKDGRTLTGIYEGGKLSMEGGKVVLTIAETDIVRRTPVDAPAKRSEPEKAKAAPKKEDLQVSYAGMLAEVKALHERERAVEWDFYVAWVARADLSSVGPAALPADPKESEIAAFKKNQELNARLDGLRLHAKELHDVGVERFRFNQDTYTQFKNFFERCLPDYIASRQ